MNSIGAEGSERSPGSSGPAGAGAASWTRGRGVTGMSVLTGATWELASIRSEQPPFEIEVPEDQRASYTLEFATDGTASAQVDCNVLAGTYAIGDPAATSGELTLSGGASTLAMCPEGSLADVYVSALAGVTGYAVAEGTLTLEGTGGTLVFEQATR